MINRIYKISEASAYLGISINSLWKKAFCDEFSIHFSKSELQFALAFIEDLLEAQKQEIIEEIDEIIENHTFECDKIATSVKALRVKIKKLKEI